MMWFFVKSTIKGCNARGDGESDYLTRFSLVRCRLFQVALHTFHRSDADHLHDHPWPFVSIVLRGGYWEITPTSRRFYKPGSILFRPANWLHRVSLPCRRCRRCDGYGFAPKYTSVVCADCKGRGSVEVEARTLIFMGPVCRPWGFIVDGKWIHWKVYFDKFGCKKPVGREHPAVAHKKTEGH